MTTYDRPKPAGMPTWTDLITPEIDAARAFYQAVFHWEYDISGPEFGGYTNARIGSGITAGLSGPPEGAPPVPASWSLYFASADLEADVAKAVELGATVIAPPMEVGTFGGWAICSDPTGGVFGLWKSKDHIGFTLSDELGATTWYELYSPNAQQARDFYAALLGAEAEPLPGDLEYYALKHGETQMAGIMQIDPAWGNMPAHWVMYFMVANADATVATVTEHGGKIMGNIDDSPFGRIAALSDPQGAIFKILEPPAR
ncbi:MAG: VOC family protein [Oscillochloris sp.]|nr:VOC family protein [Oscillochloris sp.]